MQEKATKRDSFVFYRSYLEALEYMPEELRLSTIRSVIVYALDDEMPDESLTEPIQKMMFMLVRPLLDASLKRRDAAVKNGRKGGAPRKNTNAKKVWLPEDDDEYM